MGWQVYLSGEIRSDWRERIEDGARAAGLDARFTATVVDHAASDAAGAAVLGEQERPAGYAAALGEPLITLHPPEHDHALKEVDRAALAVAREPEQVVEVLRYALAAPAA